MRLRLLLAPLLLMVALLGLAAAPALADHSHYGGYHAPLSGADHLRYSADPRQRHYRPFLRDNRGHLRHYSRPFLRDNRRQRHYSRPFLRDNRGLRHHSRPFLRGNRGHLRHHRGGFRSGRHLAPRGIAPRRPLHLPDHRFDQRRFRAPARHGPSFRIRID